MEKVNIAISYFQIKYLEEKDEYDIDEPNYIRQGKYCGNDNPGQMTINSDHAQIHFVSDKWVTGSGFRLEWQLFGKFNISNNSILYIHKYMYTYRLWWTFNSQFWYYSIS